MSRAAVDLATADDTYTGPVVEVTGLKTGFETSRGLVRAVDGVSFSLARGKTLGIVGESGSGKSVLSRSVMGLLPNGNVVREGSVRYQGNEIIDLRTDQLRRYWGPEMAMVFQDPMTSLNPVMKVGAQITESLRFHLDMSRKEAEEAALELLRLVRIPEPRRRFKSYPHQLSGGMRQRIVIAIALACGPRLLLADEPTTALDVTVQSEILDLLQQQQRERLMAMILVTHDLGVVASRTDEIAVMYAGQIVEKAPTKVLFSKMKMPYTEALLQSIPKVENPPHTRLRAISGRPPDLASLPPGCRFAPRCQYAQNQCREEMPPMQEAGTPDHLFRCWFPVGTPEGQAALEKNLREKETTLGVDVTERVGN